MGNTKERKEVESESATQTCDTGGSDAVRDHCTEEHLDDGLTVAQGRGGLAALTPRVQVHMSGGSTGPVLEDPRAPSSRTREWVHARSEVEALEIGLVDLARGHAIHLRVEGVSP